MAVRSPPTATSRWSMPHQRPPTDNCTSDRRATNCPGRAWTTDRGSVRYTSSVVPAGTDPPSDLQFGPAVDTTSCTASAAAAEPSRHLRPDLHPARGTRSISRRVAGVLCATIYDSINTLRPLLPTRCCRAAQPSGRSSRWRACDSTTASGAAYQLRANIQMPGELATVDDGCSGGWQNFDDISGSVTSTSRCGNALKRRCPSTPPAT